MTKLLLSGIIFSILQINNANALSAELGCAIDQKTATSIPNGTRTKTTCAYVQPNCKTGCTCCTTDTAISYTCRCDSGYNVVYQGTSMCACVKTVCVAGQYLSDSECKSCPSVLILNGSINITSDAGSTKITDCYATNGTNQTGTYEFTEPCHYTSDDLAINHPDTFN